MLLAGTGGLVLWRRNKLEPKRFQGSTCCRQGRCSRSSGGRWSPVIAGRGPQQELTLSAASSFFCHQVFFDDVPSSSTSLPSSVLDQTKTDPVLARGEIFYRRCCSRCRDARSLTRQEDWKTGWWWGLSSLAAMLATSQVPQSRMTEFKDGDEDSAKPEVAFNKASIDCFSYLQWNKLVTGWKSIQTGIKFCLELFYVAREA